MHCIFMYSFDIIFGDHLSSRNDFRLVVIYDMNTTGNDGFEVKNTTKKQIQLFLIKS